MEKKARIEELVAILNKASEAYYNDKDEIMSNFEWDGLYDELALLEKETGYVLPESPTQNVGTEEAIGEGRKEPHEYPALSLAKSKDVSVLQKWAGERPIWISWKLDGITLVATYDDGALTRLLTRGNGQVGTNITYLAPFIQDLPENVEEKGHLVVRGEAVISYDDFSRLNGLLQNDEEQYANPRNLVAGTLALDAKRAAEVRERCVRFRAFTLVYTEEALQSWGKRMDFLAKLGFCPVDREPTSALQLPKSIESWTQAVRSGEMKLPVDGLVITYDDTEYAATGSVTGHHATNAGMAFKWQDTVAETVLDHVEWSCAASTISPVAVFDMVQLEGTQVRRASLCNISEMKRLGIGADRQTKLKVIKSNMIIPKCIEADAQGTEFTVPKHCPVCGAETAVRISEKTGTESLHCTNEECSAKQIQKFARFVSKNGMDIDGLSEKTLVRFMNEGFISDFADIYGIEAYRDRIIAMDGFGEKSYANIVSSVERSRNVDPVPFLYALCIPMVGLDAAKKMTAFYGTEETLRRMEEGSGFDEVDGIGPEKSNSIIAWFEKPKNRSLFHKLLETVTVRKVEPVREKTGSCAGLTFVITGDVHQYKNRAEFTAFVESQGGKVAGSVSKKTNYLVNNDSASSSSKNTKARQLGIPILTEEEFLEKFGN